MRGGSTLWASSRSEGSIKMGERDSIKFEGKGDDTVEVTDQTGAKFVLPRHVVMALLGEKGAKYEVHNAREEEG